MNKNLVFNAICLFIAAVALGYIFLVKSKSIPNTVLPLKTVEATAEAKIIAREVDKKGIEHVITEQTNSVLPKGMFINPSTEEDKRTIDSLLNDSKVKKDLIQSLTQVNYTTQAKNIQAIKVIDSLKKSSFTYKGKDIYLSYTPNIDSTKAGLFDYKLNQSLSIIQYRKGNWLGINPKDYLDISSDDPNTTINSVKKLTIESKSDNFSLDVSGKAGYSFYDKDFNTGPGIRIRLGKTTLTGDYLYNTTRTKFYPWVGIERKLFSF